MSRVLRYVPLALAGFVVLVGIAIAVGKLLRGPSTVAGEAVADAPEGCCLNAAKGWDHDPWCKQWRPSVPGRTPADEVLFYASLTRMEDELDSITEGGYRLPGERAS